MPSYEEVFGGFEALGERMEEQLRGHLRDLLEQAPGGNEESAAGPQDVVEEGEGAEFDDVERLMNSWEDGANVDTVGKFSIVHETESVPYRSPNEVFMDRLTATSFKAHVDNIAIGAPAGRANSESANPPPYFPITVDGEQFWLDQSRYTINRADNTVKKTERERRERRAVHRWNRRHRATSRPVTPSTATTGSFSSLRHPPRLPSSPPRPEQFPLPPLPPPSNLPAPQAPSSQLPPAKSPKRQKGKLWTEEEDQSAMRHMKAVIDEKKIFLEARFEEVSRRMRRDGFERRKGAIKNRWNRELRDRCGPEYDERRKKTPNLESSQQGKKKKNSKEQAKPATPPTQAAAGAIEPVDVDTASVAEANMFDEVINADAYYEVVER